MRSIFYSVLVVAWVLVLGASGCDSRKCEDTMNKIVKLSREMDAEAAKTFGQPGHALESESKAMWAELKPKGLAFCREALAKDESLSKVLDCISNAATSSDLMRCPRVEELSGMLAPR